MWDSLQTKFYVVWADYNSSSGVSDLMFTTSTNGQNWASTPSSVTTPNPEAIRSKPHLAFGDGQKYVVWEEQNPDGSWSVQASNLMNRRAPTS